MIGEGLGLAWNNLHNESSAKFIVHFKSLRTSLMHVWIKKSSLSFDILNIEKNILGFTFEGEFWKNSFIFVFY